MGILAYGLLALAIIGSAAGFYAKISHDGYERGEAHITELWEAQNAKAREIVLADRKRQEAVRDAADKKQTGRLANEKKRTGELMASLEAHIKATGAFAGCRISPELLNDTNNAITGGKGISPGTVPSGPKPPAPAR
jgi:hypothetical protein